MAEEAAGRKDVTGLACEVIEFFAWKKADKEAEASLFAFFI